jgi:hypothetical protein
MLVILDGDKIMININQDAQTVLTNLRNAYESVDSTGEWGMTYIDNAREGMEQNKFRAQLAVLSKAGLYRVVDGYAWGEVKVEDNLK